jgi:hypothetical protein
VTLAAAQAALKGASALVTLDPGLVSPAVAVWRRDRAGAWILDDVHRVHQRSSGEDVLQRARIIARKLQGVALPLTGAANAPSPVFVSEWPEARSAGRGKNSASQLMGMCAVAALVSTDYDRERCFTVGPSEWALSTPKAESGNPVNEVRGSRIWGALSGDERAMVHLRDGMQLDVFDAIGIGLVVTGRLKPGLKSLLTDAKVRRV